MCYNILKGLFLSLMIGCRSAPDKENNEPLDSPVAEEPHPLDGLPCGYDVGELACDFKYLDQHGNEVRLYDFYEKAIILDLSTAWCYYCNAAAHFEPQVLSEIPSEDVVWVTVLVENREQGATTVENCSDWAEQYSLEQPVLAGDYEIIDQGDGNGYPITGWPTFFIINKEMIIVEVIVGWSGPKIVESVTENL